MKKKIFIRIIIVFIIFITIIFLIPIHNNNIIIAKGYAIFGNKYCPKEDNDFRYEDFWHSNIAGQTFTSYRCLLCNQSYWNSNTDTPLICPDCGKITGRCGDCGKLKK